MSAKEFLIYNAHEAADTTPRTVPLSVAERFAKEATTKPDEVKLSELRPGDRRWYGEHLVVALTGNIAFIDLPKHVRLPKGED